MDLPASFAALTGQTVTGNSFPDSFNVLNVLLGVGGANGREHLIQSNNTGSSLGFREGKWKIVGTTELYDLDIDPSEQNNLASQNPTKLNEMVARRNELMAMTGTAWPLSATTGDGFVNLDWTDSSDANFASYNVYRGTTAGGPYTQIATGLVLSNYTDNTVTSDITYYYVFTTVYTDSSQSFYSNEVSATPRVAGLTQQAEDATIVGGSVRTLGSGWNGTGYVDLAEGGYVEFTVGVPFSGIADLEFRTTGNAANLAAEISINGTVVNSTLACPNTASWNTNWQVVTESNVYLNVGSNTIRFRDNGNDQPQIDQIEVVGFHRLGELPPYDGKVDMREIAELGNKWLTGYDMDTLLNVAANWLLD
jgi:hypothetical protein